MRGSDFHPTRKYKRVVENAVTYDTRRVNVGSIGIMPSGDDHWELCAAFRGGEIIVSEYFRRREWLESALYVEGFCARHGAHSERLMQRLVRMNWALPLPQPRYLPEPGHGRPWNAS